LMAIARLICSVVKSLRFVMLDCYAGRGWGVNGGEMIPPMPAGTRKLLDLGGGRALEKDSTTIPAYKSA
jgi:hypothetical protein